MIPRRDVPFGQKVRDRDDQDRQADLCLARGTGRIRTEKMLHSLAKALVFVICTFGVVSAQEPTGAWLDVPFVMQEKNGCGSASIAMVMQYWLKQQGRPTTEDADAAKIHQALYVSGSEGIYASDMEKYFKDKEFQTFAFRGDWEILQQHLKKGRPLIAALKPSGSDSSLHYVVVVGADPDKDLLYLNDPARRKLLKHDRSDFQKQWKATGNWTLLAVPQTKESG